MIRQALDLDVVNRKFFGNITLPGHGKYMHLVSSRLAGQGNAQKITLQSAKGKIVKKTKSKFHNISILSNKGFELS